jgi:energy-coupling factor transporter ATP-binding protein EcfA2
MSREGNTPLGALDRLLWAARARDLLDAAVIARLDPALAAARAGGVEGPIDPLLVIMLCGPTAVGKSSLLNALAGADIAPVGVGATTDRPLVYVHEADDPARLFAYGQALGELAGDRVSVVRHARAALRGKVIVDTPDIDSAVREHRAATEAAAAYADILLYVTSPEKYKVEEPLRWLAAHRQRHGIGFVLNKWDAAGMGMQFAQRERVAADFRALVGQLGFNDPHLFFVSAEQRGADLGALRDWMEAALDDSTAMAVAALRRRAGWGEIAAALTAALATITAREEDAREAARLWSAAAATARDEIHTDAARLATLPAPAGYRPRPAGLLGLAAALLPRRLMEPPAAGPPTPARGFGEAAPAALRHAAAEVELFARMRGLQLGTLPELWAAQCEALAGDLATVPARAEAACVAASVQARLRRAAATLWLGLAEVATVAVLALTLWRLVSDFIHGTYAPFALLVSAAAIVGLLAAFGQLGVRLLFPNLARRIAAAGRRMGEARLDQAATALTAATAAQIEAAVQLRTEGTALLAAIDREIALLSRSIPEDTDAARLFAAARSA